MNLSSFFEAKCFLSLNSFINAFYSNISSAKYCIPYLSALDKKKRIQNLVENLRWIFLQKLLRF